MTGPSGSTSGAAGRLLWVAFALPAFGSAFLVFWIEPLFTKLLLPVLGGVPAVWNTALMYYQAALLAGYLYAHVTVRLLGPRRQAVLHVAVTALVLVTLPLTGPEATGAAVERPVAWVLGTLTGSLAAPFVLLAATAPLLQRWLAAVDTSRRLEPYTLYAVSNVGSFGALLAFPLLLEPRVPAEGQLLAWSWGLGVVALLLAACVGVVWRLGRDGGGRQVGEEVDSLGDAPAAEGAEEAGAVRAGERAGGAPGIGTRLRWLVLSFVPSSLLLGVTAHLSTDVAALPLLWIAPLGLYLLTFVVAFGRPDAEPSPGGPTATVHAVFVTAFVLLAFWRLEWRLAWAIPFHLGVFTLTALVLHRRLAAARPAPERLTEFYLWVAFGGVLGGAFNALAAPVLFDSVVEYELVLVAACFLRPSAARRSDGALVRAGRGAVALLPALLLAGALGLGIVPVADTGSLAFWLVTVVAAIGCLLLRRSAWRLGLALASLAVAATALTGTSETVLHADRSFFGSHRVTAEEDPRSHVLYHGTTVHGAQLRAPDVRRIPTTYYHPAGPAGWVFETLGPELAGSEIAVIGLGTGSLVCHGRPGQRWTLYEIDPEIERIATDRRLFSFLADCGPSVAVETGDARVSLAREPPGRFSLIVLDAFNSDAIPVHLLTREALAVYRRALAPGGVLLFHVSNRYLDLEPVLARLAAETGMAGRFAAHEAAAARQERELASSSEWIVLADRRGGLGALATDARWRPLRGSGGPLWTDDHTAIVELFR